MGALLGMINANEYMTTYPQNVTNAVLYDAVQKYFAMHNAEMEKIESLFVEQTVEKASITYAQPQSAGYLQRLTGVGEVAARRGRGTWSAGFMLEKFGDALMRSDDDMARMTPAEFEMHIDGIRQNDRNTRRLRILQALSSKATISITNDIEGAGAYSVVPLASQDGTMYARFTDGVLQEAQNYIGANYVAGDIDATNNPIKTAREQIRTYFGQNGSQNLVTFINSDETEVFSALPSFREVGDPYLQQGDGETRVINTPANLPGVVLGRGYGSWIIEWDFIPSGYSFTFDLNAPKPLFKRIPVAEFRQRKGLQNGLTLINEGINFPLHTSRWENWFGYGVANRLNGVWIQYVASTTYTDPTVV
jgi:hypothetical protein